jgi:Flp pilus assembly CpaF family ATPase
LQALNTGARGLATTLHCDSCVDALYRLEDLLRNGNTLPPRTMIVRFVDFIVYMQKVETPNGREHQIADMLRVLGVDAAGEYVLESVA